MGKKDGIWTGHSDLTDTISEIMFTNRAEYGLMELGAKAMGAKNPPQYATKLDLAVTFWKEIIKYMQEQKCHLIFRNAACYAWGHNLVAMTYAALTEIGNIQKAHTGEQPLTLEYFTNCAKSICSRLSIVIT